MNRQTLFDSFVFIHCVPPGVLIFDALEVEPLKYKVTFMIKEHQSRIDTLPENGIDVEFRSNMLVYDNVAVIPLVMRINNKPSMTYQVLFNFHESDMIKQYFDYLINQDSFYVLFFTGNTDKPERMYTIGNTIQLGFRAHLQKLKTMLPWSLEDFDRMKSLLLKEYPTTISLWEGLKERAERR